MDVIPWGQIFPCVLLTRSVARSRSQPAWQKKGRTSQVLCGATPVSVRPCYGQTHKLPLANIHSACLSVGSLFGCRELRPGRLALRWAKSPPRSAYPYNLNFAFAVG